MSDRPPYFNPSYPGYPGPPSVSPGIYPPLPGEYRPPNPPYNPSFPGYPAQPIPPACSAVPIYDSKPPRVLPATTVIRAGPIVTPRGTPSYFVPQNSQPRPQKAASIVPLYRPFKTHHHHAHAMPQSNRFWFVPSSNGSVPEDAVHAGQDEDGGPIFLGRAYHDGDLIPAKICPTHGCAFVSYGGEEVTKLHYEVLCSRNVAWTTVSNGQVHPMAIRVGNTSGGEPLYAGRVKHEGTITPGKVHPSHGVLYIPFRGGELPFHVYEILISI